MGAYHFRRVSDTPSREERCPKKLYSGRPRRHALHPFDGGISHSFDEHTHGCDVSVSDELPSDDKGQTEAGYLARTWEGGSWDKSKRARGCPPARRPRSRRVLLGHECTYCEFMYGLGWTFQRPCSARHGAMSSIPY